MRTLMLFLIASAAFAQPMPDFSDSHKIGVQNAILAKVNGTTISMIDVKKKMDMLFHQNYPHLAQSSAAKFQFYQANWRHAMMDLIDGELILADAADKEVKLTDGEVREEIERRFGPNVPSTLDKIGLTQEEAWRLVKNEMIIQRMNWWFVHAKALAKVTPQDIRQAYKAHLNQHPAYTECKYRIITLKGTEPGKVGAELASILDGTAPENLLPSITEWEKRFPGTSIAISDEYTAADKDLAESYRSILLKLEPGKYSEPRTQTGRDKKEVCRIFYLNEKTDHPAPTFEEMAPLLKNQLLHQVSSEISKNYIGKLRSHYRFDDSHLQEMFPEDLQPFTIE